MKTLLSAVVAILFTSHACAISFVFPQTRFVQDNWHFYLERLVDEPSIVDLNGVFAGGSGGGNGGILPETFPSAGGLVLGENVLTAVSIANPQDIAVFRFFVETPTGERPTRFVMPGTDTIPDGGGTLALFAIGIIALFFHWSRVGNRIAS